MSTVRYCITRQAVLLFVFMNIGRVRAAGELIRERRRKVGMSQAGLAEAAGLSRHHLSNIENGSGLSTSALRRIAEALGDQALFNEVMMAQVRAIEAAAGQDEDPIAANVRTVAARRGITRALFRSTVTDTGFSPLRGHRVHAAYRDGRPLEVLTGDEVSLPDFVTPSPTSILIRVADDSLRAFGAGQDAILFAERLRGPAPAAVPVLLEVLAAGVPLTEVLNAELPTGRMFVGYLSTTPDQPTLRRGTKTLKLNELAGPYHAPFSIAAIFNTTTGGEHAEG